MEVRHFFFYGSLMTGFPNHEKFLKSYTLSIEKAKTTGKLYHLPSGYPAMCVGDGEVRGEVMLLQDTRLITSYLDFLEGYYGPGREENHYERIIQEVEVVATGEKILAYLYVYPPALGWELELSGVVIPHGDWNSFLGELRKKDRVCSTWFWQG